MNTKKNIENYCTGCALCSSCIPGINNEQGFYRPNNFSLLYKNFNTKICYSEIAPNTVLKYKGPNSLWGNFSSVYMGHSTDSMIRKMASSGGVITAISLYLLNEKIVDGIIHVGVVKESPITTRCSISYTKEEVLSKMGSRYSISNTLIDLENSIEKTKKYAVIGKPCDIQSIKEYLKTSDKKSNIIFTISFFCAGLPTRQANQRLLKELNVAEDNLKELRYRGDGWPGYATAVDKQGNVKQMPYEESWGGILGRDIQKICKFCWDGLGESADISCGDGWYLKDGKPDFTENDGRNVIFIRSSKGESIFKDVVQKKYIEAYDFSSELNTLINIQPGQVRRKAMMFTRVLAMKIMFQPTISYKLVDLLPYAKHISLKENIKSFLGTIKRIMKKRI